MAEDSLYPAWNSPAGSPSPPSSASPPVRPSVQREASARTANDAALAAALAASLAEEEAAEERSRLTEQSAADAALAARLAEEFGEDGVLARDAALAQRLAAEEQSGGAAPPPPPPPPPPAAVPIAAALPTAMPVAHAVPVPAARDNSEPAPAASDLPTAARGFLASLGIGAEPEPPPAVKRPRARTLARREGQMAPVRDGNSAPSCGRCDARFGMKTWRHHCRNCGACVCNACCVTWCNFEVPHAFLAGHGEAKAKAPRVCRFCNDAAVAFRRALLSGEATTAQRLIGDGTNNLNVHCALAGAGGLLPVHLAAAANSVATLQWLAEAMQCPMDGPDALTVGKPPKPVLRVAIEHAAIDVLQWLIAGARAPVAMPADSGCAPAAVHRALERALRDGWRQRQTVTMTLDAAATAQAAAATAAPPPPMGEIVEPTADAANSECVVCLDGRRECVFVPCGHVATCEQCSGTLVNCPICRASIERVVRVYNT